MGMDDNKLKSLLQEGMEYEADCIMAEVDRNPDMKDVIAPEEIHDKLMKQIREHEEAQETEEKHLSKEERELIRLGKIYKKKRGRRKYTVLIVAAVCALGVGTISFGDGKKVFTEIKSMFQGLQYTRVSSVDEDRIANGEPMKEDEAYEEIESKYGFTPVRMNYIPEGMEFVEVDIEENLQYARLCYADSEEGRIAYRIITKHRDSSSGADVEDDLVREYKKEINQVVVNIQEYLVKDNNSMRWKVSFTYKDAQYSIMISGTTVEEVEKIVENLYFV